VGGEALDRAGIRFRDLDGIAVTVGPGLIGMNHLEGHI
jgi:tRNA A37 threonylcarbamoyltransferase TsaD